jgi:hypothetical protein
LRLLWRDSYPLRSLDFPLKMLQPTLSAIGLVLIAIGAVTVFFAFHSQRGGSICRCV